MSNGNCPRCNAELAMRMNKKTGERIFCPECKYPDEQPQNGVTVSNIRGARATSLGGKSVKIITNRG